MLVSAGLAESTVWRVSGLRGRCRGLWMVPGFSGAPHSPSPSALGLSALPGEGRRDVGRDCAWGDLRNKGFSGLISGVWVLVSVFYVVWLAV